jgi:Uma2 family endonuclease
MALEQAIAYALATAAYLSVVRLRPSPAHAMLWLEQALTRRGLETPMPAQVEPRMTVADLEVLPDDGNRYELIEGELIVSRAPSLTHQRISGNLFVALRRFLDQHRVGEILATPGVIFDDFNGVIPDLIFMSNERRASIVAGERLIGPPELVIEIVSPGAENSRRDRVAKRQIYSRFGVDEYWIVDPNDRTLEIYRRQADALKLVATLTHTDMLTSPLFPGFVVAMHEVFAI